MRLRRAPVFWAALPFFAAPVWGQTPLPVVSATASSSAYESSPTQSFDGNLSDSSRWLSARSAAPSWLELRLAAPQKLAGIHLFSGWNGGSALTDFEVQFWQDGAWQTIPSAQVKNNVATALSLPFDETLPVETDRLRLWITKSPDDGARVAEVRLWSTATGVPPLPTVTGAQPEQPPIPLIFLNQSGFDLGRPKRFTAPTLADGTPFMVSLSGSTAPLFSGTIRRNIGDLSAFNPVDGQKFSKAPGQTVQFVSDKDEFVVRAGSETSVPFRIAPRWLERVSYQNAVDFMVDARHYVGNDRRQSKGSFGWRDDHHFGWELHTLVPQYLSNPSAYDRMPRQIRYEAPTDPKLWGALLPPADNAPDIVKLIHWGADVVVTQQLTHEHLKAQLAYFLAAWPVLKEFLPAQNYQIVRDYAFKHWSEVKDDRQYPYDSSPEHDLLALKTQIGTTKGDYPPGFSIEPNLLMFEVAQREKRPDAAKFLNAAVNQAAWIVKSLDWNDPQTTKGQRMSEWLTLTGLAHLQSQYPGRAPAGLREKIAEWAKVVVRRSDNMWDFRKLDDGARWTPMGETRTQWNEVGNVVGLPAALLSAQPFLDGATQKRIEELVFSHFDDCFGRNPTGRHFSYDAPREIEGVEFGWYSFHVGGIGRLADTRFVLDGAPKDPHYPFNPQIGNFGWSEGWVQFNTAFNVSLAYLAKSSSHLSVRRDKRELVISLDAPLDFNSKTRETATVQLTSGDGKTRKLTLLETAPNSSKFSARVPFPTAKGGSVRYGFGYWGQNASLPLAR